MKVNHTRLAKDQEIICIGKYNRNNKLSLENKHKYKGNGGEMLHGILKKLIIQELDTNPHFKKLCLLKGISFVP